MRNNPTKIRQAMGCGFLPKQEGATPWRFGEYARDAPESTVCVGYLRRLPEVDEIARTWLHWSKGQALIATGGEMLTEKTLSGVEFFDFAINAVNAWKMTPRTEGGGQ